MAVSKAQIKATAKYEAKTYDKTLIRLPKGRLDEIRAHIEPAGESLNGFIGRAILEAMERDGGAAAPGTAPVERVLAEMPTGGPQRAAGVTPGAGVVTLPSDTLEAAQRAAERAGETVGDFLARAAQEQAKRDEISLHMGLNSATGGKLDSKGGTDHE